MIAPLVQTACVYLAFGIATAATIWSRFTDEIDMGIAAGIDQRHWRITRILMCLAMVLTWPIWLAELLGGDDGDAA